MENREAISIDDVDGSEDGEQPPTSAEEGFDETEQEAENEQEETQE